MAFETITVRKFNPSIGAEIEGVDLTKPVPAEQLKEIRRAWMENLVIVFRDQPMTTDQHLAFGRQFGELHIHPATLQPEGYPEILVIKADENSKRAAGEEWHTDVSCEEEPPMGSMLHITVVPPDGGGDTLFANMYRAYETLPDRIKTLIEGMTAVHDGKHIFEREGYRENKRYPIAEHPMVRTHPETGRKALFVNRVFTTGIVGLNKNQSDHILQMLYRHIETPEFCSRVHWRPNTLTCWDNRCTQHRALWDYFPNRRYGQRVTVKGDRPFFRADGEQTSAKAMAHA
jgi:taurine dioxygenase